MSFQQLSAAYQRSVTPLVTLCWATSLGTLVAGGVAAIFDQLAAGSVALGMLGVSAFYLVLGLGYFLQHKFTKAGDAAAEATPPAPLGLKLKSAKVDDQPAAAPQHEMASV